MNRPKRKTAPVVIKDIPWLPQDTKSEEEPYSNEDEILAAVNRSTSSDEVDEIQLKNTTSVVITHHGGNRTFKILKDSISPDDIKLCNLEISDVLSGNFFGKTPMQSAKSAFLAMVQKNGSNSISFIFTVQEVGGNNKLYSYRGSKEFGVISIKACRKISPKGEPKKSAKKIQPPLEFIDDGIHIEKKIIPPLAKTKK